SVQGRCWLRRRARTERPTLLRARLPTIKTVINAVNWRRDSLVNAPIVRSCRVGYVCLRDAEFKRQSCKWFACERADFCFRAEADKATAEARKRSNWQDGRVGNPSTSRSFGIFVRRD